MRPHTAPTKEGFVCVGTIIGAHGIKGEVKFKLTLEDGDILKKYGVPVSSDGTPFSIASWRQGPKGPLLKFKGINDRDQAEELRGVDLFIPRDALPTLDEEELYYTDIVGMAVFNHQGEKVGKVADVFSNGANDVLTIYTNGKEVLLPFSEDTVAETNPDTQTLKLTEFADDFFNL